MGEGDTVQVVSVGQAVVVVFPEHYFEHQALKLEHSPGKKPARISIDTKGAKATKKQATEPKEYVTELQTDLVTLKYLPAAQINGVYGAQTARAVLRFQRHAKRVYRMPGPADVKPEAVFQGAKTGVCDIATAKEIRAWIAAGFVNPVGRFKLRSLNVTAAVKKNKLREDAATEWEAIVALVGGAGAILTPEANGYGDTTRTLQKSVAVNKVGASSFSFHFCGRAVDIDQGWVQKGRYFIQREVVGKDTFWRIFCKADKTDGSQGQAIAKAAFKVFSFFNETEFDIKAGFYVDMTALIESRGTFKRIHAQRGFDDPALPKSSRYNKSEWWHFQYSVDVQETFLDELELAGFTEDELRAAGWATDAELDHAPG